MNAGVQLLYKRDACYSSYLWPEAFRHGGVSRSAPAETDSAERAALCLSALWTATLYDRTLWDFLRFPRIPPFP